MQKPRRELTQLWTLPISVEIDIKMLEPDGDPNMIIISLGLLAIGKIGQELNL